jgi:hypothetical protein
LLASLGIIAFLVVIFIIAFVLNGIAYLIADKLGLFKAKVVKYTWFDKLVHKAIIRYYGRK